MSKFQVWEGGEYNGRAYRDELVTTEPTREQAEFAMLAHAMDYMIANQRDKFAVSSDGSDSGDFRTRIEITHYPYTDSECIYVVWIEEISDPEWKSEQEQEN